MAQFMGKVRGSKGGASRLGTKKSGLTVAANAWDVGVRVVARHENGGDCFDIFMTAGSNNPAGSGVHIGTVQETDGGTVFSLATA